MEAAAQLDLPETGFCGRRGFLAGLRTLLTNGVPAVMPVAVNEGLISILLIAGAGVSMWGRAVNGAEASGELFYVRELSSMASCSLLACVSLHPTACRRWATHASAAPPGSARLQLATPSVSHCCSFYLHCHCH